MLPKRKVGFKMTYQTHEQIPCRYCGRGIYFDSNRKNRNGVIYPLDYPSGFPHNCIEYHEWKTKKNNNEFKERSRYNREHFRERHPAKTVTRKITEYKNDGGIVVIEEKEETPVIERRLTED